MNKLTHIGVYVSDLLRSEKFYINALEGRKSGTIHGDEMDISFIDFPGGTIELIRKNHQDPIVHTSHVHIAFDAEDIDAEFNRIKAFGIKLKHQEPAVFSGGKLFFFYGPDGEELEYCSGVVIERVV